MNKELTVPEIRTVSNKILEHYAQEVDTAASDIHHLKRLLNEALAHQNTTLQAQKQLNADFQLWEEGEISAKAMQDIIATHEACLG